MADTDDIAAAAAAEAGAARQQVQQSIDRLRPLLQSLGYQEEQQLLDAFAARFTEFVSLDEEVLPLAVENSNLKAQRLSFGPLRQQAVAFRTAVDAAARRAGDSDWRAQALAARAAAALLEAEVLTAPHIAEAQDAEMTRMESDMTGLRDTAAAALEQLRAVVPPAANADIEGATAALGRFQTTAAEIISLSRRNSDVRSLALTLGRKRAVTALCEEQLRALDVALAKHQFAATR